MEYAGLYSTIAIVHYHYHNSRGLRLNWRGLSRDQTRPCVHDLLMAYVQGYARRDSGKTEEAFPEDFDI